MARFVVVRALQRVLALPVLEGPADEGGDREERADDEQPPADREAEGEGRRGGAEEQRPPAVRAGRSRTRPGSRRCHPAGRPTGSRSRRRRVIHRYQAIMNPSRPPRIRPMTPTHSMPSSVDAVQNRRSSPSGRRRPPRGRRCAPWPSWVSAPCRRRRTRWPAGRPGRAPTPGRCRRPPASCRPAGAVCGWCRSNAGRSERIRGMLSKLCRGGGQEVAHSSEAP